MVRMVASDQNETFHRHEARQLLEPILNDDNLAAGPHAFCREVFHEQEAALPHVVSVSQLVVA